MFVFLNNLGGMVCLANVRGGGEYGDAWHKKGIKDNKQRAVDDIHKAAEWLIKMRITDP